MIATRAGKLPPAFGESRGLQPDPRQDLEQLHAKEMRGTAAHVPIEQAMREVAREGVAGWPRAPEDRP